MCLTERGKRDRKCPWTRRDIGAWVWFCPNGPDVGIPGVIADVGYVYVVVQELDGLRTLRHQDAEQFLRPRAAPSYVSR